MLHRKTQHLGLLTDAQSRAMATAALTRPVKGAPLRGRGGPGPTPLTGRCAGSLNSYEEMDEEAAMLKMLP